MLLALLVAAGAGTAAPPEASKIAPPEASKIAPPEAATTALIREVVAEVEQIRGLKRKVNLKVELLDAPLFVAKVREKAREELKPEVVAEEKARWLGFDLAPADADPARILLEVLDEQVAGFYDPHEKKLFVRDDAGKSPDLLRLVLAHEIEHALQDQSFGIPEMATLPDDDVRLARSALLEGDAMAVMTAYAARRAGRPIEAAMRAAAQAMRSVGGAGVGGADMEKLRKAPAVVREELLFPYVEGFAFVAEAWRRGGFAQVDKLFQKPPQSTHQVLHPEAYFAGEEPATMPQPPLPAGAKLLARGKMGELGARLAFQACLDPEVGREFVPAWLGDSFTVYELHGHAELIWQTAWTGTKAENVANLLQLMEPCWAEQKGVAPETHVARKGNAVAVTRGSTNPDTLLR